MARGSKPNLWTLGRVTLVSDCRVWVDTLYLPDTSTSFQDQYLSVSFTADLKHSCVHQIVQRTGYTLEPRLQCPSSHPGVEWKRVKVGRGGGKSRVRGEHT